MHGLGTPAARGAAVVGLFAAFSVPAAGQTTVFNSNGFETPTFTVGNLTTTPTVGQQGFRRTSHTVNPAAQIVSSAGGSPVFAGNQAFKITGQSLRTATFPPPIGFGPLNFWWKPYDTSGANSGYKPLDQGTPFVQASFQGFTTSMAITGSEIPLAGIYLEGYTASGEQQSLTPVMVSALGAVTVFTDGNTIAESISTEDGLIPREQWNQLTVEFNFNAQTFRVYHGTTPLEFDKDGEGGDLGLTIIDVPFRNFTGNDTVQIAEIGMIATDLDGGVLHPTNDFFIDNYLVTASVTSQLNPVPEPGSVLAGTALAVVGWRLRRRVI